MASQGGQGNFAGTNGYTSGTAGNAGGYGNPTTTTGGVTNFGGNYPGMGTANDAANSAAYSSGRDSSMPTFSPPPPKPTPQQLAQALLPAPVPAPVVSQPAPAPAPAAPQGFGIRDPYHSAFSNVIASAPGNVTFGTRNQSPYTGYGPTSGPGISGMAPSSNLAGKGGFGVGGVKGNYQGGGIAIGRR